MTHPAYSSLKAAWHLDRIAALREKRTVVPVELQLLIADYCNQSCKWCAYRAEDGLSSGLFGELREDGTKVANPKRFMAASKASEILDDAAMLGVKSVIFTGGGEPTAHPKHMDLFTRALILGFKVSLNTNGLVMRDGWQDVLPRFAYVRFSVDASSPEEYGRLRSVPENQYAKVLVNLAALVDACKATECVVGAGYVVTPENYGGLAEGLRNLRDTGVGYVRIASMQSTKGRAAYGVHWDMARAAVREAIALVQTPTFSIVNLFESAMGARMDSPFCGFQHLVHYVGADLNVYRCCYTAYSSMGTVGSLANIRYLDFVRSSSRADLDDGFDARDCPVCPMKEKNELIAYMADPAPVHVDFV